MAITYWILIAHETLHMPDIKQGEESWWCVDRKSKIGEKSFLYKPLKGITHYFEILEIINSKDICLCYAMNSARIKILKQFEPPITAKMLKRIKEAREEEFIRKNFQGKSFIITNPLVVKKIINFKEQASVHIKRK